MAELIVRSALLLAAVASCARPAPARISNRATGNDVTLYRDVALIRQRITVTASSTAPMSITAHLASGVAADQIVVVDSGGLEIRGVHARTLAGPAVSEPEPAPAIEPEGEGPERDAPILRPPTRPVAPTVIRGAKPTTLRLDVVAPRAGTYEIEVAYTTDKLRWDVAYTLTSDAARERGELRGALALRNDSGVVMPVRSARVVDAELVAWRAKVAERLAATLVGGTLSSTLPATPRELGPLDLRDGETRVELVHDGSRRMRSVLVYDPIGTALDHPQAEPIRDPELGASTTLSTRVTESFEVARDSQRTLGLPAGPVRLLVRSTTGALSALGEARLFDAATRVSDVDTIAIGTAIGVTAKRERREITVDEHGRRLTEEILITITNDRANAVDVLLREHLYRGQNWRLSFHSALSATKDGPQQISLRTRVPPRSQRKVLYVVVYTWNER